MRGLRRNKSLISYALFKGKTKLYDLNGHFTGDYEETYEDPVKAWMNIAPATGEADWEPFGISTPFSKIAMTFDLKSPISATTKVWIDKSTDEPANYVVVGIARSKNCIRYALKEVDSKNGSGQGKG